MEEGGRLIEGEGIDGKREARELMDGLVGHETGLD